jgi:hypothetical protein
MEHWSTERAWLETPPLWAQGLADEAIRERDCVPSTLYPSTPREEDGSLDDLLFWLLAVERFLFATSVGWIRKEDWCLWRQRFEAVPAAAAHFAALLPSALQARRLRRGRARAEARCR